MPDIIYDLQQVTKSSSSVIDVLTLSTEHQEQIINRLLGSSEVIISLVYESGATLLRGSLFAQDLKVCMSGGMRIWHFNKCTC